MKVIKRMGTLGADHHSTITVDWVVLGAAIVGLAIALLTSLHSNDDELARALADDPDNAGSFSTTLP